MTRRGMRLLGGAAALLWACGGPGATGTWRGEHPRLGAITLMLDADGHYEATFAAAAARHDSAAQTGSAGERVEIQESYARRTIAYGGTFERHGDTIRFSGAAPFRQAILRDGALELALEGEQLTLRR